jgi:hypothetical protein
MFNLTEGEISKLISSIIFTSDSSVDIALVNSEQTFSGLVFSLLSKSNLLVCTVLVI